MEGPIISLDDSADDVVFLEESAVPSIVCVEDSPSKDEKESKGVPAQDESSEHEVANVSVSRAFFV